MKDRHALRVVIAVLAALALLRAVTFAAQPDADSPVVYTAVVDSVIHPVSAQFIARTIDEADRAGASLVVLTLRTPGGLVDSTREIVAKMIRSKAPVAVFVGPSGSRAASAGFLITLAADVAAMAPATHIGAAHPVSGGGERMDEDVSKKAAEDLAAYARTLATARHRNVDLSARAVLESRAFTESEALDASPPLIDLVVDDVAGLIAKLDGRSVSRFDGGTTVVRTAGARIVETSMSLRERILSTVANPNVAYLLLSLGMLGLTIELWSPGAVLPGVVGGVSLLLAFFALQVLPVNVAGVLLLLLGLLLFALEVKIASYGLLTLAGVVCLLFGSLMLIDDAGVPELRLSLAVILPVVVGFTSIGALLVRLGMAAQRSAPVTGVEGLIGQEGDVLTSIEPPTPGSIAAHGEIWRAQADSPIPAGVRVRIVSVDGLTLTVRRE
jgi:membrane-bound serine protease (ClpP class)